MAAPELTSRSPLMGFGAAETIVVDRVLGHPNVASELSALYDLDQVERVADLSRVNRISRINESLKGLSNGQWQGVLTNNPSLVDTMAPGTAADDFNSLIHEPEIVCASDPRPFTLAEAAVVISALRIASRTRGHRLEAASMLAQYAPGRTERAAWQAAFQVERGYSATQLMMHRKLRSYKYTGRHEA